MSQAERSPTPPPPEPITVGSICTGYGGIELALDLAGVDHRLEWVSEIDPTASAVLADHWPHVPNIGDINDANPEPIDVITAGFPCQDISVAGQQAGIHGERSGLWWRIRDVVGHLRPQWVLLENVAAITVNGGPAVVGSLTELGYDCRWGIVRASDAGAPHQRARWFCLAWNTDSQRLERPGLRRPTTKRHSNIADTNGTSGTQQVAVTGRSNTAVATHDQQTATHPDDLGRQRAGQPWDRRARPEDFGRYWPAVHQWEQLTRPAPVPTTAGWPNTKFDQSVLFNQQGEVNSDTSGRLNPRFVEWMMGLPDQWVNHGSRAAQLRCLGNGVVPQQAALALKLLADH